LSTYNRDIQSKSKLTILWHSVAPWIQSGYGKVTKNVTTRLVQHGYKVIVSAYYGCEPGGMLNYNGVYVVASKEGQFGIESARKHCNQLGVDISILHTDWWAFSPFPRIMKYPCIYSPMDHINYPEEILTFTRAYRRIIALAKFQKEYLKTEGIDSIVIPHGIDLSLYKPLNKELCKKEFNIEEGKFVFGTVGANSDKEDRKFHLGMMKAMRYFLDNNPDVKDIVWLYHTNPSDPRGLPLLWMMKKMKLENIIRFTLPDVFNIGLSEDKLVRMYNTMDVHLLCSKREGFGLPILESQACKVPNIVHDFSSMPELVKGHGWIAKSVAKDLNYLTTPLCADCAIPDVYDIADKISRAYFKDREREKYAKVSRQFSLKFNWDDLIINKWLPLLEEIENDIKPKSLEERKIV